MGQAIWIGDDFQPRFQRQYLQTIFPLALCTTSVIAIIIRLVRHQLDRRKQAEHDSLVDLEEEEDLTLQTTRTHQSRVDLDAPRGEFGVVAFELALLLGQLVIGVVGLLGTHSTKRYVFTASIAFWSYLLLLALVRLYSTIVRIPTTWLKLWNHSASIYCLSWLLQVWTFRSTILHGRSRLHRHLTVSSFVLTSTLSLLVLLSRRGNRVVQVEYEDDIPPPREPLSSILGKISFAWCDAIVWQGFKKPLEMKDVWNIAMKDKAENVLARFRQVKKTHMLAVRLLLFFQGQVVLQGLWCAISSVFMFMPTLILKAILEYLEDPTPAARSTAWLNVILLFVAGIIQATGDGQSLWIGRKICINIRAVIIGEVYSKVLRRKAAAAIEKEPEKEDQPKPKSVWQRIRSWRRRDVEDAFKKAHKDRKPETGPANNGTVINLMSIDSFKVAEICAYLHFLWAATPVQLVMAVTLLYRVLGYSSFVGITLMVLLLPLNMYIANSFQRAQKRIMAATDARIHATNEVLQNIRIIKYFAWEQRFEQNVNEKRRTELAALWSKYILWASAYTVWSGVPILITFTSFLVFTKVEKKSLIPSIAFPALSMFSLLRIPLDQLADMVAHVQESKVSVDRVEAFLNEEETEKYLQLKKSRQASPHETRIGLQDATLGWGSVSHTTANQSSDTFRLINMSVDFEIGKLNVIAGPTGSGKTSLLLALLGEMELLGGMVHIPGGYSRQTLRPDHQTGLTESVAYCAQQAWLVNATIRENILFAVPYDEQRYRAVVSFCALKRDFEILDAGDRTLVGEKGITLSGGQKQRISLARALYSTSKHILLDDCLSAVDAHTAKHIFNKAIMGPLMYKRTCILVSHNITLTVPQASHVVVLGNGKIVAQGSPAQVIESGKLGDEMTKSAPASRVASTVPSRATSPSRENQTRTHDTLSHNALGTGEADGDVDLQKQKTVEDTRVEKKAEGSVKLSTILGYLRAMGPWWYWIVAAIGFLAVQLGSVATNVWIRQWANAYHTSAKAQHNSAYGFQHQTVHAHALSGGVVVQTPITLSNPSAITAQTADSADVNATYYLSIYALIGAVYIIICLTRELILFKGSQQAAWLIHERLLKSILRATFKFFDSTPLGQLTNRFSKDIQAIDQEVAPVAIGLLHTGASALTVVILIATITPGFLVPGFFIALIYTATGVLYIRSSRDLKRIESVQRSPLFQHFGETLSGVVTIRAYGDESRFVQDSHRKVNTHNRPFIYLWATNRWLAFRIDCAGALVSFFSAMFVVVNVDKLDAGAAGLSLSYAITFTQNVLWLVRLYAANEQNMNAVERIQEYIDIEQEAPASIPETKPASSWPDRGAVKFVNYSTRYRSDLDPVLRGISFEITAGEKVGIVGRTGAGKSSLALALFRGLEAEEGQILIDGVDIGLIGLQDLREAITIVPQDPTLFTGTLRSNLDPFGLFSDEQIFTALRRVQLISSIDKQDSSPLSISITPASPSSTSTLEAHSIEAIDHDAGVEGPLAGSANGTLSSRATLVRFASNARDNKNMFYDLATPIAESGSNLSQGQRQLLCLARALLKSPKVLVMDEATASIDYATDSKIQDTLRELKNNTIITIAHRLQTIIDYDKVLVLDKGEVVEYAHPWELISKEDSSFRAMCDTSGELEVLLELAKKAWEAKRLVDV